MQLIDSSLISHIALADLIFTPTTKAFYTVTAISAIDCELTPTFYDGTYGTPTDAKLTDLIGYVLIKVTNY